MPPEMTPQFDSERLKELRSARGLSVEILARHAEVTVRHIWRLESGGRPNVWAVTLGRIALALDTSVDYLLGLTDDPRPFRTRRSPNTSEDAR
jgi:transcriptional regulator with XRE-family HTH domain